MKFALAAGATLALGACATAAQEAPMVTVARAGSKPAVSGAPANFTGAVRVESRFERPTPARTGGAIVIFEAGSHTAWHSHPRGQTLIVTAGTGLVQQWGAEVQPIRPGDVVWIPPGVKHWHGASPDEGMTHIAVSERLDGKSVDWMEKLPAGQYPGRGSRSGTAIAQ